MWIFKAAILFTAGFLFASGASTNWIRTGSIEYYASTVSVNKSLAEERCQERNSSMVEYTDFARLQLANGTMICTTVQKLENPTCNTTARYVCVRPANMTWGKWEPWTECSGGEQSRRREFDRNEYMVHHRPCGSNMETEKTTDDTVKSTDLASPVPISSTSSPQTAYANATTTSSTTDGITTASNTSATTIISTTKTTECSGRWKFDAGSFFVGAPIFFVFLVILAVKHYHLLEEMRAAQEELDYMKEGRQDLPNELDARSKLCYAAELSPRKARNNSKDESVCEVPNRPTPFYENVTNANDEVIAKKKPPVHTTTHVNSTSFLRDESLETPDYENVEETGSCHISLVLDEDVGYINPTTIPRKHDKCEDYEDLDTTPVDPRNESVDKPDHVYVNVTSTSKGFVKIPRFVSVMKAKVALKPPKNWRLDSKSHTTSSDKNVKPKTPLKPVNNKTEKNTASHQSLGLALKSPRNDQPGSGLATNSTGENANPKAALKPVNNKKEKNTPNHQSLGLALKPPRNDQPSSGLPTNSTGENANSKDALKPVNNNKEKTSTGYQNNDFKKVKAALKPTANSKSQGIKSENQRSPSFANIVDAKNALTPVKNA